MTRFRRRLVTLGAAALGALGLRAGRAERLRAGVVGRRVLIGTGAAPFLPGDSLLCLGRELQGG